MIPKSYFLNVPNLGDLELDYVVVENECPIDTSEDGIIFELTIDEANREYIITSGDGKIIIKGVLPEDYLDIKYKDELNEISDNKLEEMLNNKNKSK